ncbi:hypothetical protein JCM11641_000282 [Rhodosporidiobolus odoratus]
MPTTLRTKPRRPLVRPAKDDKSVRLEPVSLPSLCDDLSTSFASFGTKLAQHQTASLLLTALVICSLLSPAIILTFSSPGSPFDLSPSAITRRGRGELIWELDGMRRQGLISTEEAVCWERVKAYSSTGRDGGGRRVRVEQVLVSVAGGRGRGRIGKGLLHRTWRVQRELERRLLAGEIQANRCLIVGSGTQQRCATLSPTGWWESEEALLQDDDVHRTLSSSPPSASASQVPLTASEVFVGIGKDRQGTIKTAQQLVLTFFLEDVFPSPPSYPASANFTRLEDVAREGAKSAWRQAVRHVSELGLAGETRAPSRHVLLKFLPHLTVDAHPRRLENWIYATGYILVLCYVSRYIRRLRTHSKMGLLVTGVVELTASGIMSVSICWLLGWSLELVPWNLLAFLVLTSGLDNMILVLRAIAGTNMNDPVPQRMSAGLKSVGVEMTILLLVEEFMAGALLSFVQIDVMREWIRFGAVVLVVDYFLELTFFSTVLSIDIQRLELADLLTQNTAPGSQVASPASSTVQTPSTTPGSFSSFVQAAWKVLRERPAKTSTVAFLWCINLFLWTFYGSEHYLPAACSQSALSSDRPFLAPSLSPAISRSLRLGKQVDPASSSHLDVAPGAGLAFWQLLNPSNATSVQVYLEPIVAIQFLDEETLAAPESIDLFTSGHADVEPTFATKATLVLVPIAVVMGLLYLLLLYLLKDADLLQAHWGSEERLGGPDGQKRRREDHKKGPAAGVQLSKTTKTSHEGDVELLASGGSLIASWAGLEEKVSVYSPANVGTSTALSLMLDIPLGAEPTSLTALSIDGQGRFCAAATTKGRLLVWSLRRGGALIDFGSNAAPASPVISLVATPREADDRQEKELAPSMPAPPVSAPSKGDGEGKDVPAVFLTLHRNGDVFRWDCASCRVTRSASSSPPSAPTVHAGDAPTRRWLVPTVGADGAPLLAMACRSGRLTLSTLSQNGAKMRLGSAAYSGSEQVTTLQLKSLPLFAPTSATSQTHDVVIVGTSSGTIYLSPFSDPTARKSLADLGSPVRQLRLLEPPNRSHCPTCSQPLSDGFLLLASTRSTLTIFRVFTPPTLSSLEHCSCNTSDTSLVSRSRSSSTGLLGSPVMTRTFSNGGSARRFSPRKKPQTPTRPAQLPPSSLGDSPIRPTMRNRAANGSHESMTSSSGAGSPTTERAQPLLSSASAPPPPPPYSASAFPPPLDDPSSHPSTLDLPPSALFDPLVPPGLAPSPSPTPSPLPHLRAAEVASVSIDERSGWEVLDSELRSGSKVVGLRRAKPADSGTRGWEVWSVGLGKSGAAFDEGFEEGSTSLTELLEAAGQREAEEEEEKQGNGDWTTSSLLRAKDPSSSSSLLRRRNPPPPPPPSSSSRSSTTLGTATPPSRASAGSSSIRFSETNDLPFSRARPLVPAIGGKALCVGLGNQVIMLQESKASTLTLQSGFLGI